MEIMLKKKKKITGRGTQIFRKLQNAKKEIVGWFK